LVKIHEIVKLILRDPLNSTTWACDLKGEITSFASLYRATPSDLSFCKFTGLKATEMMKRSNAGLIICSGPYIKDKRLIVVSNPRLWFIRVVREFFLPREAPGIHPSSVINWDCVEIGKNVRIGPNCSIGFEGFGFEGDECGDYHRFPHIGKVIIGDNVEIGANTCIDRGALEDTIIGPGTKIDNLVHVAHNVRIGKNCMIIALTCLGGGVIIEDGAYVGIGAGIRNQITIGEKAFIGMGAVVVKDVDPGVTVIGNPAKPMRRG